MGRAMTFRSGMRLATDRDARPRGDADGAQYGDGSSLTKIGPVGYRFCPGVRGVNWWRETLPRLWTWHDNGAEVYAASLVLDTA